MPDRSRTDEKRMMTSVTFFGSPPGREVCIGFVELCLGPCPIRHIEKYSHTVVAFGFEPALLSLGESVRTNSQMVIDVLVAAQIPP